MLYDQQIRNHITKHYQLMPLSLATYATRLKTTNICYKMYDSTFALYVIPDRYEDSPYKSICKVLL
ncbi:hypothetical protein T05_58 [Trichinella murrelli]|uniref:Uncharacterized protein n=1 Tax=Trichinella murrelli TaxID=144512 RepID=A0A0V0TTP0_9BILA|nr:hypothetical protein T05_58 [Trichinella murrelli]